MPLGSKMLHTTCPLALLALCFVQSWGKKRSTYYGADGEDADFIDEEEEEALDEEEEEARRMQEEHAKDMEEVRAMHHCSVSFT